MTPEQKKEFHNSILADLRNKTYLEVSLPIYFDYLVKEGIISNNALSYSFLERAKDFIRVRLESKIITSASKSEYLQVKETRLLLKNLENGEFSKDELLRQAKILFMRNIDLIELEKKLK